MKYLERYGVKQGVENYNEVVVYSIALLFNRFNSRLTKFFSQFDISPAAFNALMTIQHQGKEQGINQTELTDRLIVNKSNVTRSVDRLMAKGLITREQGVKDRRENFVKITAAGMKVTAKVWPKYLKEVANMGKGVSKNDRKVLAGLLVKFLESQE